MAAKLVRQHIEHRSRTPLEPFEKRQSTDTRVMRVTAEGRARLLQLQSLAAVGPMS
jgi:hypothetical protein